MGRGASSVRRAPPELRNENVPRRRGMQSAAQGLTFSPHRKEQPHRGTMNRMSNF